jgi:hypothetical protein
MSNIPSSAMPHAGPTANSKDNHQGESGGKGNANADAGSGAVASVKAGASKIADTARENPKTAIAAGVAIVAGVVAAAAIPLMRGTDTDTGTKSTGSKKKTDKA